MANKSVVNYSTLLLDKDHISLLERGLKFCPTPFKPNLGEVREDMDRLHKRLRQISFYENLDKDLLEIKQDDLPSPSDPFSHRKFRLKSTGKGPIGPLTLEAMMTRTQ